MRPFERYLSGLSIRRKILLTKVLTTTVALLLACGAFFVIEAVSLKKMLAQDLATQAEVIARNCGAALSFHDPEAALETLQSLQAKPNIVSAHILTPQRAILASYRPGEDPETSPSLRTGAGSGIDRPARILTEAAEEQLVRYRLGACKPVLVDGETIGSVLVISDLSPLYTQLRSYGLTTLLVMMIASGVAWLIALWLSERISKPVLSLAGTMAEVARREDYSLRARKLANDEIGTLIDHFNSMLGKIEDRDRMLEERGERLQQLAHFDALTGLPNRLLIADRLAQAVTHAATCGEKVAVMFIDLDHFKDINDSLGHRFGDLLLQEVAARLRQSVRGSDNVGRLGGDEFVVFLSEKKHIENVVIIVQRLLDGFSTPFTLEEKEIFITASIGVTFYPADGEEVYTLLKNADTAMYSVKESGKNGFQFFSPDMQQRADQRLGIHNGLRKALERDEFTLVYQPTVDIESGDNCGLEALIRWQCPTRGLVSPVHFIPVAEETGLIIPIGEWVLREVCRQICRWRAEGFDPVRIAINISAVQLRQPNFTQKIREILAETATDPDFLIIELTESALINITETTLADLWLLKEMGIRIAIDDFGTGYSSLNYLRRIPLDFLKIDRSFVENSPFNKEDQAIIKAILGLGQSLSIPVVGEGVETAEQLSFLKTYGCNEAQGFLFSAPVPPAECHKFLHPRANALQQ